MTSLMSHQPIDYNGLAIHVIGMWLDYLSRKAHMPGRLLDEELLLAVKDNYPKVDTWSEFTWCGPDPHSGKKVKKLVPNHIHQCRVDTDDNGKMTLVCRVTLYEPDKKSVAADRYVFWAPNGGKTEIRTSAV